MAGARVLRRHASNKEDCTTSGSTCGASSRHLSKLRAQFAPMVNEARAVRAGLPGGSVTDTRNPVSTHLMSKSSCDTLACSFMTPTKMACALFHGLLIKSSSRAALNVDAFKRERITGKAVLDIVQHLLVYHGSEHLFEPKEYNHFGVKCSVVTVGEFPVEQVQVPLLKTRLRHAHELFDLLHCDASAANVPPAAPPFESDSGCHECVRHHPGRGGTPTTTTTSGTGNRAGGTSLVAAFQSRQLHLPLALFSLKSDRRV